jgi:aldose 1-epimerase
MALRSPLGQAPTTGAPALPALAACAVLAAGCHASVPAAPPVARRAFGTTADGTEVTLYTLANRRGMVARVTDYGATLTELWVPDRDGRLANVVLGFDRLEPYLETTYFLGTTVGRVANRIANARFTLDGREYRLAANRPPHHIHGGARGFDKRVWRARPLPDGAGVAFAYTSPDGEEGYPGTLDVTVTYTLTDANELRVDYAATTDRPTPVNLTNHSFFNLAGAGTVLDHVVTLHAARYTPVDATLVPTGAMAPVAGTALDFTRPRRVGERIEEFRSFANGYDHNFVLDGWREGGPPALAARVEEPTTGRVLELRTTEPGLQFFTGNRFDGTRTGVGGIVLARHAGLALEPQHFPDSVNRPEFPSVVLRPGTTFRSTTVYGFSTDHAPRR